MFTRSTIIAQAAHQLVNDLIDRMWTDMSAPIPCGASHEGAEVILPQP
jgi:hypothetical protein